MNRKMSKRQRDIKSKLMAAICMLLVSSIMMVSTTYAWFTLSTAPEVTGITTAVGANGNLEMALLNPLLQEKNEETNAYGGLLGTWGDDIKSSTEDSMDAAGQTKDKANITWGNLVDLKDNKTYGLDNIMLYPAKLNVTAAAATPDDGNDTEENGTDAQTPATVDDAAAGEDETDTSTNSIVGMTIGVNPLQRPVYGSDGRVASLTADTLTAAFSGGTFSAENAYGVRAVGTASDMTARQLAHRTAMNAAATASTNAKGAASGALTLKGNALAGMAIKKAGGDDSFTRAEIEDLKYVVDALANAHNYIQEAMTAYTIAHNLGAATVADDQVEVIKSTINGTAWKDFKDASGFTRPTDFDAAYDALATSRGNVTSAQNTLKGLLTGENAETQSYVWDDFSGALNAIMNYEEMSLCDVPIKDVAKQENGQYVNLGKITPHIQNLQLQMPSGSGVLADIADFCGEYSASITFAEGTTVIGVPIAGFTATMITNEPKNPTYLADIRTNTTEFTAGTSDSTTVSITDFYGYIVDLGFRTNAANSNLLLQTEAVDRIYEGNNTNDETMGGGSTMTFRSSVLNQEKVIALMQSLRVVFFDPDTKTVLAEARLDPASVSTGDNNDGTATAAEGDEEEGEEGAEGGTTAGAATNTEVTMDLYLWDAGAKKADSVITPLAQNIAKAVSVLVYLDGESVRNADVAATGSQSMSGSMNLQFASSAELTPMEYSDLKNGKTDAEGATAPITLNNVKVDANTAAQGYAVEAAKTGSFKVANQTYTGFGVSLSKAVATGDTVTATVSGVGTPITGIPTTINGVSGYAFQCEPAPSADTEIIITVTKANSNQGGGTNTPATTNFNVVNVNSTTADITASGSFDAEGNVTITVTGLAVDETITGVSVDGTDVASPAISGSTVTFTQTGLTASSAIVVKTSTGTGT